VLALLQRLDGEDANAVAIGNDVTDVLVGHWVVGPQTFQDHGEPPVESSSDSQRVHV